MGPILLITTEPLPLPGRPATGAGLRAWGLAVGLREAGFQVQLMTAAEGGGDEVTADRPDWVGGFARPDLPRLVREFDPELVVLQHWGLAALMGEPDRPLAIDLAGPHLLERRLWGSPNPEADLMEKLDALRRADFVTTSGRWQRHYFLPYLAMAGWDVLDPEVAPVIPFSLEPAVAPAPPRPDRFFYGGFCLPWQDPSPGVEAVLEAMDRAGRGRLVFVGGAHPTLDVSRGRFEELLDRLQHHPRVELHPPLAHDPYRRLLAEGGVALDLMHPNAERELAFTTRTVGYLAAGLPVLHDNYSELGDLIARSGAGWAMDPVDPDTVRNLLLGILEGRVDVTAPGRAAHALVRDHLHWHRTIGPLVTFCRDPQPRTGRMAARLAFEERDRRLRQAETELARVRAELNTLRGKRWIRWGLGLIQGSWMRWPAALAATLVGLALVPVFVVNDLLAHPKRPQ